MSQSDQQKIINYDTTTQRAPNNNNNNINNSNNSNNSINNSGTSTTTTTTTKRPKSAQQQQRSDEIRTLFVRGLPTDIHEREIHNLFRFFTGYEGCILNENTTKQVPVAFVIFNERELALRAMRYLQDVRLDLNSPTTLRLDFAKSNSKTKRISPNDLFPAEKRMVPPVINPPYYPPPYSQYGANYGINPPMPWYGSRPSAGRDNMNTGYGSNTGSFTSTSSKVPPCSTLFVANIHPDVPERDLLRLFKTVSGFQRLKMSQKDGSPICFVEYLDVHSSTSALHTFQAFMVGPSPIRIEYARARMGESKRQHPLSQQSPQAQQHDAQDGHVHGHTQKRNYSDGSKVTPHHQQQQHSPAVEEDTDADADVDVDADVDADADVDGSSAYQYTNQPAFIQN